MQTITSPTAIPTPASAGVVVSSAIKAGGRFIIHSEGIVVSSAINAGGRNINHSEGIVVSSAIKAGGRYLNHSETLVQPVGIAVTTPIRAGGFGTSPGA